MTHRTSKNFGILLAAILLTASMGLHAFTYRWVDEEGNVHYSDRLPPEQAKAARSHLDKRGIETKRIEAAKTAEELAREKELEELRAVEQRLINEQQERDLVLMRTFRSEDDILMARDGKLASIDTSIQIDRTNIHRMKLKLSYMQKNAADIERQGQKISANLLKDIESTRKSLRDSHANIIHKEQQKASIREKYSNDLARFRELKKLRGPIEPADSPSAPRQATLLETVVICKDDTHCDELWVKAETYVREHATTRLQLLANSIIMTASPIKDNDITIAVSRIVEPGIPGAKLFMDLQCKDSPRGKDYCLTPEVDSVRTGFRQFLSQAQQEQDS